MVDKLGAALRLAVDEAARRAAPTSCAPMPRRSAARSSAIPNMATARRTCRRRADPNRNMPDGVEQQTAPAGAPADPAASARRRARRHRAAAAAHEEKLGDVRLRRRPVRPDHGRAGGIARRTARHAGKQNDAFPIGFARCPGRVRRALRRCAGRRPDDQNRRWRGSDRGGLRGNVPPCGICGFASSCWPDHRGGDRAKMPSAGGPGRRFSRPGFRHRRLCRARQCLFAQFARGCDLSRGARRNVHRLLRGLGARAILARQPDGKGRHAHRLGGVLVLSVFAFLVGGLF